MRLRPAGIGRRRGLGLRARATVALAAIALAVSAGLSTAAYLLARSYLVDQREAGAVEQAFLHARTVRAALEAQTPTVPQLLSSLRGGSPSTVVLEVGGRTFSSTVGFGPERVPSSLRAAVQDGAAARQRARIDEEPYVAVGIPIPAVNARLYELAPLDELDRTLDALVRALAIGAALAAVAGATVGRYASGRVMRPLGDVTSAATGIAGGRLDIRLDAGGDPDLLPLVSSFNAMADAVEQQIAREKRFASDVSHELRAPLAAMASAVSVARRRGDDPVTVREALDVVDEKLERFQDLVLDLLEISRIDAGVATLQPEPVAPAELARQALAALGHPDVPVACDAAPDQVVVDRRRMGQVLTNLIENADRYGGSVTQVRVSGTDGRVRFEVEDAGPGIPPHERAHVFERFTRGEMAMRSGRDGSGLGLALVAEHVRLHGGKAWVEDGAQGGARFVVELPVGEP